MESTKTSKISRCVILFVVLVEVRSQLEVTVTIEGFNHVKFRDNQLNNFYQCMCLQKEECTYGYNRFSADINTYIVNYINQSSNDTDSIDNDSMLYICDKFDFQESGERRCSLSDVEDNACVRGEHKNCSTVARINSFNSTCPCISLQWIGFDVVYGSTCAADTECDTQLVPQEFNYSVCLESSTGKESSSGDQSVAIGAGLGSALVIVIIIAFVVIFIMWRRQKKLENRHVDQVPEAALNSYSKSQVMSLGNCEGADTSGEDNYGYTEYVEPGSKYYEIGEDGQLAACRDEELGTRDAPRKAGVVEEVNKKIGLEEGGYSRLNVKKDVSSSVMETYDRAAGSFQETLVRDEPSTYENCSKQEDYKGEDVSYSGSRPISAATTLN